MKASPEQQNTEPQSSHNFGSIMGNIAVSSLLILSLDTATSYYELANPPVAEAASCSGTHCDPQGTLELSASGWLNGNGVDVYANAGSASYDGGINNYYTTSDDTKIETGEEWQCVELINRLYLSKGWINDTWSGNGNTLKDHLPAGLSFESNGSIDSIKPGDVITLDDGGYGHAGIVNSYNTSTGTVDIVSQNTVAVHSSATLNDKTLKMSGWSGYSVQGVIEPGGNTTTSSPPTTQPVKPAALSYNGELDVFVRGGNQIYKDSWLGDHWTGFSSLGGNVASDPVAIQYGSEMDVFATGTDGHVYKDTWNGLTWSGFNDMGGGFSGTPAVAVWGSELDIFAKGGSGIYKDTWTGDHWTGFSSLGGGGMAANPTAVTFNGELDVFARDGYGTVYKDTWNGSTWSGFNPLGGNIASSPAAVQYGQELEVYGGSGVDGNLFKDTWGNAHWSGFNYMGHSLGTAATPAAISYNGEMDVYVRSTNGAILKDTWNGRFWSGLNSLGGSSLGDPVTVQYGQEMDVFATDSSGHTYKDTWNGSTWSGFGFLG